MSSDQNNGKYKILLVEDDENIARLFTYNLKKAGYQCELATDGAKGFEKVKEYKPDLIISDIMMPKVDGFEFRKMLLEIPEYRSIPFIFLTAKGAEEDVLKGYDMDIQEYIIKTSSPKVVLAKLQAILRTYEKEKSRAESEVQKAADSMGAKVVPDESPSFEGFEIKHWHVPYQNVPGGDFIDYVKIDENKIAIVLGDVMGKKWGAWYFAIAYAGYVRSAIRFAVQSGRDLSASEIMSKVNESVFEDERIAEVFVTLSIIILNKESNTADYCGAGDLPLFYFNNSEVETIKSEGLLLGFNTDGGYEDLQLKLNPNDELFLITDGIIESRNAEGKSLEKEGLMELIKESDDKDSFTRVKEKFDSYTQGKYEDDVSMIYIKKV